MFFVKNNIFCDLGLRFFFFYEAIVEQERNKKLCFWSERRSLKKKVEEGEGV